MNTQGRKCETTPKLCSLCSRPAFLTCIDCDTIYCSSICQVEDWENHRKNRVHIEKSTQRHEVHPIQISNGRFAKRDFVDKKPQMSVQSRLKAAAEKPPVIEMPEITAKLDNIQLAGPSNGGIEQLIDYSSSSDDEIPKEPFPPTEISTAYKTYRPLKPDADGYCRVLVQHIEIELNVFHYLTLAADQNELVSYKSHLQETYNGPSVKRIDPEELAKNVPPLFLVKINDSWTRCVCVVADGDSLLALDLDSGMQKSINIRKDPVIAALPKEYTIPLFCFKAELTNLEEGEVLEVGDVIEVKVMKISEKGVFSALVKYSAASDISDSDDDISESPLPVSVEKKSVGGGDGESEPEKEERRITLRDIRLKILKPGKTMLTFADGSKLAEGNIAVYEATPEHHKFIEKVAEDIEAHVTASPDAGNFKPIQFELLLARFTDGKYYRGVCKKLLESGNGCHVVFLEYCNAADVEYKDVRKLPESLLRQCITRTLAIRLKSGRSISDIDAPATVDKFYEEIEEFEGIISDDAKTVTLDDSLFVFKTK